MAIMNNTIVLFAIGCIAVVGGAFRPIVSDAAFQSGVDGKKGASKELRNLFDEKTFMAQKNSLTHTTNKDSKGGISYDPTVTVKTNDESSNNPFDEAEIVGFPRRSIPKLQVDVLPLNGDPSMSERGLHHLVGGPHQTVGDFSMSEDEPVNEEDAIDEGGDASDEFNEASSGAGETYRNEEGENSSVVYPDANLLNDKIFPMPQVTVEEYSTPIPLVVSHWPTPTKNNEGLSSMMQGRLRWLNFTKSSTTKDDMEFDIKDLLHQIETDLLLNSKLNRLMSLIKILSSSSDITRMGKGINSKGLLQLLQEGSIEDIFVSRDGLNAHYTITIVARGKRNDASALDTTNTSATVIAAVTEPTLTDIANAEEASAATDIDTMESVASEVTMPEPSVTISTKINQLRQVKAASTLPALPEVIVSGASATVGTGMDNNRVAATDATSTEATAVEAVATSIVTGGVNGMVSAGMKPTSTGSATMEDVTTKAAATEKETVSSVTFSTRTIANEAASAVPFVPSSVATALVTSRLEVAASTVSESDEALTEIVTTAPELPVFGTDANNINSSSKTTLGIGGRSLVSDDMGLDISSNPTTIPTLTNTPYGGVSITPPGSGTQISEDPNIAGCRINFKVFS